MLDDVREEISILVHHDAITGTSSPSAENNWQEIINRNYQELGQLRYHIIEKLGRIQSKNVRVDMTPLGGHRPMTRPYFQNS